ncbi:zinc finger protein 346 isoform X2 [Bombina bombina]|nr:zinc finger protein 346 isoform X2 [Bombina bombina]
MSIHQGEEFSAPKKMKMDTVNKESTDGEEDKNKYCTLCNMAFSSPVVAMSHYEGKKHSKSLKMKEQGGASDVIHVDAPVAKKITPAAAKTEERVVDKSDPEKYCKICSVSFTNPQMALQHYAGKRHKKQETKNKLISVYSSAGNTPRPAKKKNADSPLAGKGYFCDTCKLELNSIEQYQAHISGFKHKNHSKPSTFGSSYKSYSSFRGGSTGGGGYLSSGTSLSVGTSSLLGGISTRSSLLSAPYSASSFKPSFTLDNRKGPEQHSYLSREGGMEPEHYGYISREERVVSDDYNYSAMDGRMGTDYNYYSRDY